MDGQEKSAIRNSTQEISICWLRRDLRLTDNAALYHALKGKHPVLVIFIFDKNILDKLSNKSDARITFIHETLEILAADLKANGSSLLIKYGKIEHVWPEILDSYKVRTVYANHDYEPYATKRDDSMHEYLSSEGVKFSTYKDQVYFREK
jgi:deoxyribodipyrimidine photo-lyase